MFKRWGVYGSILSLACLLIATFLSVVSGAAAEPATSPPLRVQLMWYHQSQFAGYYVADFQNYFREEGVGIQLLEGGPELNPLERLQRGEVDVAVSWLDNALDANAEGADLVNVAQIFSGSSFEIICRVSAGIQSINDLAGKTISVTWPGDRVTIRAMLAAANVDAEHIKWVQNAKNGETLLRGDAPCITGVSYNEVLWVVDAGIPASDIITFSPHDNGISHVEDGLYVRADSLRSAEFRARLLKFLRALRRGWAYAKASPAPAANIVLRYTRGISTTFAYQKAMLDDLIPNISTDADGFGLINIHDYDQEVASLKLRSPRNFVSNPIWTMSLMEEVKAPNYRGALLTSSTRQYLRILMESDWFRAFVVAGIWIFGFAGGLWATAAGYNLVGRIVISAVGCMGGGVLRDLLLGGSRLPFPWLLDPLLPLGVFCAVMAASVLVYFLPLGTHSRAFQLTKSIAEDIGYACVAAFGAIVPLSLGLPWVWAPFCAWLTCCGGSLVRDVMTGREPVSFRSKLQEECTLVGGLWLVGGLLVANHFEHTRWLVTASLLSTIVLVGGLRYFWRRHEVWYPKWLHLRG